MMFIGKGIFERWRLGVKKKGLTLGCPTDRHMATVGGSQTFVRRNPPSRPLEADGVPCLG